MLLDRVLRKIFRKAPLKVEVKGEPTSDPAEKKRRLEIRDKLAEFLAQSSQIKSLCLKQPPLQNFSCKDEINQWYGKTVLYLAQNLEPAYRARFESATGLSLGYAVSAEDNGYINALTYKANALDEFIRELRD